MSTSRLTFADQYKMAGLNPSSQVVQVRQDAFEKLLPSMDAARIVDLTRLYFGFPLPAGADWFRDGFADSDKSFSLVDNAREAAFLAYFLLSGALDDGKMLAGLAPLAAEAKTRSPIICAGFLVEAREKLAQFAIDSRKRTLPNATAVKLPAKNNIVGAADRLTQAPDWANAAELFKSIANTSAEGLTELARQVQSSIAPLIAELNELREEADMLWWYVGGWTRVLDRPFSEFTPALIAVLAGFDLASLVRTTLGPVSAPAILHKLIHNVVSEASEVTIQDAVDAIAHESIARLQLHGPLKTVPDLCPVLTAFRKAEEIGPSPSWQAYFQKTSLIDPKALFSPLDLAVQVYRESLLMKHLT